MPGSGRALVVGVTGIVRAGCGALARWPPALGDTAQKWTASAQPFGVV